MSVALAMDALRKKMRAQMNDYADDSATGQPRTWDEYRYLVGKIEGLAMAERMLLDTVTEREKEENGE